MIEKNESIQKLISLEQYNSKPSLSSKMNDTVFATNIFNPYYSPQKINSQDLSSMKTGKMQSAEVRSYIDMIERLDQTFDDQFF